MFGIRNISRLNRVLCQVTQSRHKSSVSKDKNPLSVGHMLEPLKSGPPSKFRVILNWILLILFAIQVSYQ